MFNINDNNCPCYGCDKRHATCHGECDKYKTYRESLPKRKPNVYSEQGRLRDNFHKKGRVIRHS